MDQRGWQPGRLLFLFTVAVATVNHMLSETVTPDECNALPRISDAVSPGLNEDLDGI